MTDPSPDHDLYGIPASGNLTAVLGPTNTGKTHMAIERMLAHESGLIGLPLRLLAREVYDRITAKIGESQVALITGEEKIKPPNARYWVCTVEAMPLDIEVEFLAIDEVQLASDLDRGHIFTQRLFHSRGRAETLLLGADTMREALSDLLPGINFISRPRLSKLSYAGSKKISRLARRSAIVAFSAQDVYAIAELIRRQRGGTAVVLGALSPRTRNAQVEMYQSGEVDFLVATDAIGMGLNLDVNHVAFAGNQKFDGHQHRLLRADEIAQIAGRAGRHINDGTFGVTANTPPFEADIIERIENHEFEPVKVLQWRTSRLDYSSLTNLMESLKTAPQKPRLASAPLAADFLALETLAQDETIRAMALGPASIKQLWQACQLPDYRKISVMDHASLIKNIYQFVMSDEGLIPEDWLEEEISKADRTDGDIDTLANRIAHIRTWTFVANRVDWLKDPLHWQGKSREIEDRLSDALHEALTQRFVDKRTSTLMARMRDKVELFADITPEGAVHVEDHFVGHLKGFHFTPDFEADGIEGKATRAAAQQVLAKELANRINQLLASPITIEGETSLSLNESGDISWQGATIAKLARGDHCLKPQINLIVDELVTSGEREKLLNHINQWLEGFLNERIAPLMALSNADHLEGLVRGIAFQMVENFGSLERRQVAEDIRNLDQDARALLRKFGIRFGAFNIYIPLLLKPAAVEIITLLWRLHNETSISEPPDKNGDKHSEPMSLPHSGLTSAPNNKHTPKAYYRAAGFHLCGKRVVRFDMLERLADQIRPLTAWRTPKKSETPIAVDKAETDKTDKETADQTSGQQQPVNQAPAGATGDGGFIIQTEMMSIMGCSPEELGGILKSLGFKSQRIPGPNPETQKTETNEQAQSSGDQSANGNNQEQLRQSVESETARKASDQQKTDEEVLVAEKAAEPNDQDQTSKSEQIESEEIIIWRPARFSQNRNNRQQRPRSQDRSRQQQKSRINQKQGQQNAGKNYKKKGKKQKPAFNPDSPFAKLQALKDQMK